MMETSEEDIRPASSMDGEDATFSGTNGDDGKDASSSNDDKLIEKQKPKSVVWSFFGYKPNANGKPMDESKSVCKICCGEVAVKGGNTTNLFSHLKHRHPKEYSELKLNKDSKKCYQNDQSSSSSSQPTIKQAFASAQKYPRSSKRWQQLTDSITQCIAKDMLPLHTVDKPGFRKMVECFDSRYEMPTRKYFSQVSIPTLYSKLRDTVAQKLQETQYYSCTADMWSSRGLFPYMSFTVHYLDREWSFQSRCLETFFLPADHTAINIAEALTDIRQSWSLMDKDQVSITTDNGANMISAASTLGWQRLPCFGHCLNLAVTNALKDDRRVNRALGVARNIVGAFSVSWKRRRDLVKIQVEKNLPQHNLIADCPTRWGSMGRMIARLLEQDETVQAVLSSDRKTRHLIATWQDIHVWESLHNALSPLDELTDFLSGDSHITVSSIIPVLHNLATKVLKETQDDSELTKTIKKKVTDYLNDKYAEQTTQDILHKATFLDPRFKLDYVEQQNREILEDSILDEGMEIVTMNASSTSSVQTTQPGRAEQDLPVPKKKKLVTFLKKSSESASPVSGSIQTPLNKLKSEIDAYKTSPKLEIESDESPMQWWRSHCTIYPVLSQLGRKYLCISATSCASERLFSTSGNIVTPSRAALKPDKVNMLTFLGSNLKL